MHIEFIVISHNSVVLNNLCYLQFTQIPVAPKSIYFHTIFVNILYMNVAKICTINANQVGNFEATPGQQSDKMSHGKNKQSRLVEMQLH